MSRTPLISVVTTFWNASRFLPEAIASVFAQTLDDWELLLVDDGSTDASAHLAQRLARDHPATARYLEHDGHQNRGTPASRNLGLSRARGEYVALLDADDVWLPGKLARLAALLEAQPHAALTYGAPQYWHGWTGDPTDAARDLVPGPGIPPNMIYHAPTLLSLLYPLGTISAPCPSDLFFRRAAAARLGGFEERFIGIYQLYEDQTFLAKVYLHEDVLVTDECWTRYRIHPDSCSATVIAGGHYDTVGRYFLDWLAGYLRRQQVTDPTIWKALRRATWPYRHPTLARWRHRAGWIARGPAHALQSAVRASS